MKLSDLKDKLALEVITFKEENNVDVEGLYVGDLLSWVMGHAQEKQAWVSVQTHENVIAVAMLKELSCIIVCDNAEVPSSTIEKADANNLAIFRTTMSAYEICVAFSKL